MIETDREFLDAWSVKNCWDAILKASVIGYVSEHHKNRCKMCRKDASLFHHCAFCGKTFADDDALYRHQNG
jgi:hypothetical protein